MIDEITERNRELIRRSLREFKAEIVQVIDEQASDALDYAERKGDLTLLEEKLKERGAVGIRKTDGDKGYETYTKNRKAEQIESGEYEKITTGFLNKVCMARANLFNNVTQSYSYISDQIDENGKPSQDEDAAETVAHIRKNGGAQSALVKADFIACDVDSGPLFVDWQADQHAYKAFSPTCVKFKYHDQILDNDNLRGVDYSVIEDCSVMSIELSSLSSTIDEKSFLAIMGRSDDYPLGRYVHYTARQWEDIPEPAGKGIYIRLIVP